jgi:predicted component of type VI protein secretion system
MGQIADILQARGKLDQALKIRQTEELPVYEQLGDVRSLLVGRTNLAILLHEMDAQANAARIEELLNQALTAAQQLDLPEAEQIQGIMGQLGC